MSDRYDFMREARAKRVYKLRAEGVSCKAVAELVGCHKAQVRALQLLGERLSTVEELTQKVGLA